jgi:hypothetical protein
VTASLFVHVIVVPAATVIVDGLNAFPSIQTSFGPGPPELPEDDFEQLFVITSTIKREMKPVSKRCFFEPISFFIIFKLFTFPFR